MKDTRTLLGRVPFSIAADDTWETVGQEARHVLELALDDHQVALVGQPLWWYSGGHLRCEVATVQIPKGAA